MTLEERILQTFQRDRYMFFGSNVFSYESDLPIMVCTDYIEREVILVTIKGGKYKYVTLSRDDFDSGPSEAWENMHGHLMEWRNSH